MIKALASRALVVVLVAGMAAALSARASAAARAAALYQTARAHEQAARATLDRPSSRDAAVLAAIRATVTEYEALVRRYPTSGYADDALWRAAQLAADGFTYFGDARDRQTAVTLIHRLQAEYPHSRYARRAPGAVARSVPARKPALAHHAKAEASALQGERTTTVARTLLPSQNASADRHSLGEGGQRPRTDLPAASARASALQKTQADVATDGGLAHTFQERNPSPPLRPKVYPGMPPSASTPLEAVRMIDPVAPRLPTANSHAPPSDGAASTALASATSPSTPAAPAPAGAPTANLDGGFSMARQLGLGVSRIVIDPGHGGRDPGAQANGITEADLTLDIALRLETLLEQQHGVQVILTRRTDVYVPLEERTAIANRAGADLFLSIHANASLNAQAHGIETYFLNFASDEEEAAVAARENATSGETMGSLPDLVKAIALNTKLDESRDFATIVQQAMFAGVRGRNGDTRDLGVKQAPFAVLIGAAMPSVLAEISFVTNGEDASYLKRDGFRQAVAEALLDGILRYQHALKSAQTAGCGGNFTAATVGPPLRPSEPKTQDSELRTQD